MATIYRESAWIELPPERIWVVLSDLTHFARNDPFHHDFQWLSGSQSPGLGALFLVKHAYFPIFPFLSEMVECEITVWKENRELVLYERAGVDMKINQWERVRWRDHVQRFTLHYSREHAMSTLIAHEISYADFPWWLAPLKLWASWHVRKRMREKLKEIEQEAQEV